ncbi:hypothetical protein [Nostoc sp. LEGE 12447]|uniref:hypothetical protein n=1 Tax=Nostoc sp. LEGE 12447 TaxID=1828640 RepID=UPI00188317B3|nr:hypothetical protein [Nostoc sp. LEGE 12447]
MLFKKIAAFTIVTGLLTAGSANAQEVPLCFIESSQGGLIDLGAMCGVKPTTLKSQTVSQSQPQKKSPSQITQEDLGGFAAFYANKYCDWREAGGRSREESEKNASNKLIDLIVTLYGIDGAEQISPHLDVNFYQTADKMIERKCPKDK